MVQFWAILAVEISTNRGIVLTEFCSFFEIFDNNLNLSNFQYISRRKQTEGKICLGQMSRTEGKIIHLTAKYQISRTYVYSFHWKYLLFIISLEIFRPLPYTIVSPKCKHYEWGWFQAWISITARWLICDSQENTRAHHIASGFNQRPPPLRTVLATLDLSKAFDTVDHHLLLKKILLTQTNHSIIKLIANYLRGRKATTSFQSHQSKHLTINAGAPQGSVLSPALFNLYTSDIPNPPPEVHLTAYADDLTPYASHKSFTTAAQLLQPYLDSLNHWTTSNHLKLNPDKCTITLFTPDPAEYKKEPLLTINNQPIPHTHSSPRSSV